jgi:hypothetical protein
METLAVVVLITYTGAWPLELKLGFGRIFVALPTLDIGIIFIPVDSCLMCRLDFEECTAVFNCTP